MATLSQIDPEIARAVQHEERRQRTAINLIASENYTSRAVMEAQGSVLTNKYAEGYPGRRYYAGCEFVDVCERLAIERAKKLFEVDHANVQPHAGAQANMAAYFGVLSPGDTVMGMSLDHGGHLTHGSSVNFSSKLYKFVQYGVDRELETIDFEQVETLAKEHRPQLIVAGITAYTRVLDFERFKQIADEVGAKLMVDMAHIAGLIAKGEHPSPAPHADIITTTTHKTLRGPRGGMILCKADIARDIDRAVFPNAQGGPMEHTIAAKAVAFQEALQPAFAEYQKAIRVNAKALAEGLSAGGIRLVSGGTDNHMVLADVSPLGITGRQAEEALVAVDIVTNRNAIPFDTKPPRVASGIRVGTPAVTTRGMGVAEMQKIAGMIIRVVTNIGDEGVSRQVKDEVAALSSRFPVPGIDA
jgi:glycine hydroxymethyltransferase